MRNSAIYRTINAAKSICPGGDVDIQSDPYPRDPSEERIWDGSYTSTRDVSENAEPGEIFAVCGYNVGTPGLRSKGSPAGSAYAMIPPAEIAESEDFDPDEFVSTDLRALEKKREQYEFD